MICISLFCYAYFALHYVHSHYISVAQQVTPDLCDGTFKTAPVENFFNLIFSEFQNHHPVCVCVQMCPDHPTYCYPNGCFKKSDSKNGRKRTSAPVAKVSSAPTIAVAAQPMSFLVDSQSDFMENLLSTKYVAEPPKKQSHVRHSNPKHVENDLLPDPFKDRYQSMFKYRKAPKLHLRYNLREQVKHMKSDVIKIEKIDVSKTKWPVFTGPGHQFFLKSEHTQKPAENTQFHSATVLDKAPLQYQSKFFKRDLSNRLNDHGTEVELKKENVTFSLENLIENLIEQSFGPLTNDTELNLNVDLDYVFGNNTTTVKPVTPPYKRSVFGNNVIIILNETSNLLPFNDSVQEIDTNLYTDVSSDQMYKNVFNDIIATLSKHIEKNNNNSVEMMETVLGPRITGPPTERTENTPAEISTDITSSVTAESETTTETLTTNTDAETLSPTSPKTTESIYKEPEKKETKKKTHQRLTRKLETKKVI